MFVKDRSLHKIIHQRSLTFLDFRIFSPQNPKVHPLQGPWSPQKKKKKSQWPDLVVVDGTLWFMAWCRVGPEYLIRLAYDDRSKNKVVWDEEDSKVVR